MDTQSKDEEKAYAMQLEAIRRQQILGDRAMKKGLRGVAEDHRMTQTVQASDAKQKWVDPYHEKDAQAPHVGQDKL
jgi:hypothetical protein